MRHSLLVLLDAGAELGWQAADAGDREAVREAAAEIRGTVNAMRVTGLFSAAELNVYDSVWCALNAAVSPGESVLLEDETECGPEFRPCCPGWPRDRQTAARRARMMRGRRETPGENPG